MGTRRHLPGRVWPLGGSVGKHSRARPPAPPLCPLGRPPPTRRVFSGRDCEDACWELKMPIKPEWVHVPGCVLRQPLAGEIQAMWEGRTHCGASANKRVHGRAEERTSEPRGRGFHLGWKAHLASPLPASSPTLILETLPQSPAGTQRHASFSVFAQQTPFSGKCCHIASVRLAQRSRAGRMNI